MLGIGRYLISAKEILKEKDLSSYWSSNEIQIGEYFFKIIRYEKYVKYNEVDPEILIEYFYSFMDGDMKIPCLGNIEECYEYAIERYNQMSRRNFLGNSSQNCQ